MPEHELVHVSRERLRQNGALTKRLQRVPSAQRYFIPSAGWICSKNGLRGRLNIDFFSFSLDFYLGDTSNFLS